MQDNVTTFPAFPEFPRLALVGAGTLGSAICRRLLHSRQNDVLLIDPDRVEPHNVAGNSMFQHRGALGRNKVDVLAAIARSHGLTWRTHCAEIADVGFAELREYDLLLSATDSTLSRVETAFAARSLRMPMLDAGVQSRQIPEGRVSWFAPGSACSLCGLSESRRAEILGEALSASLGCRAPEPDAPMTGAAEAVEATADALLALLDEVIQGEVLRDKVMWDGMMWGEVMRDGMMRDGMMRNGVVRDEAVRNGVVRNGVVRNEAVRNEAVLRDELLRDEAVLRDELLRDEAVLRDEVLRNGVLRDEVLRNEVMQDEVMRGEGNGTRTETTLADRMRMPREPGEDAPRTGPVRSFARRLTVDGAPARCRRTRSR